MGRGFGGTNAVVVASAARTTSSNSGVLPEFGDDSVLRIQLDVTAFGGTTPTLDVVVEDTLDGTTFNTIGTFTQATGVTRQVINITTPFADRLRVRWTIGGVGGTFTFSVTAFAE